MPYLRNWLHSVNRVKQAIAYEMTSKTARE